MRDACTVEVASDSLGRCVGAEACTDAKAVEDDSKS